ncbi:MAG: hypothetical protein HC836_31865 [Richelia sp. RM2_1_2]|nr:hypothetical protein [Richelia sp. RM2_1_2]
MMIYTDLKEYNSQELLNVDRTKYTEQELQDLTEVAGLLEDLERIKNSKDVDITNYTDDEIKKVLFGE